jgi:hypothetical protein
VKIPDKFVKWAIVILQIIFSLKCHEMAYKPGVFINKLYRDYLGICEMKNVKRKDNKNTKMREAALFIFVYSHCENTTLQTAGYFSIRTIYLIGVILVRLDCYISIIVFSRKKGICEQKRHL